MAKQLWNGYADGSSSHKKFLSWVPSIYDPGSHLSHTMCVYIFKFLHWQS